MTARMELIIWLLAKVENRAETPETRTTGELKLAGVRMHVPGRTSTAHRTRPVRFGLTLFHVLSCASKHVHSWILAVCQSG